MSTEQSEIKWVSVHDVQLEMLERGQGRPILLLHGEDGLDPQAPFLNILSSCGLVSAPSHPGFGHSPEVDYIDTVDDLSYLYLDFLAARNLEDVVVIGLSLGGWIAAEMAVKSTERIAKLILVAPVGIKIGDRETRDIPDIFALSVNEVARLKYHDPTFATVDYSKLSDDQLTSMRGSRTFIIRSYGGDCDGSTFRRCCSGEQMISSSLQVTMVLPIVMRYPAHA
jgi:pimeloyl-ACP methyl ester carboxylesterase